MKWNTYLLYLKMVSDLTGQGLGPTRLSYPHYKNMHFRHQPQVQLVI